MTPLGEPLGGERAADPLALLSALSGSLHTKRFGRPLLVLARVTSTNDEARRLAEEGAGEGAAVLALRQTGGRGRRGRSWISPPGGLYLSVVLRPILPPAQWPLLSLVMAVGAAEGVEAAEGLEATEGVGAAGAFVVFLKWPNDLLVEGRKIGGILLETGPGFAVAGIGINVRRPSPDRLPDAGSIDVELVGLTRAVLEGLERAVDTAYRDPAEVLPRWKARSITLGRPVRVVGAETFDGVAEDVAGDGALLVRTAAGVRRVVAGEVSLR